LYGLVLLSALALATLVIGEVVYAFESDDHEHETHDHGFYGPIFDAAWFVFLPTAAMTLVAGAVALVVGVGRRQVGLAKYGGCALGYVAVSVLVVTLVEALA
jgi:hypothetical protein